MRKNILYLATALFALFTTGCKTALQMEAPKESYLPSNLAPAVSEFPLQMEIDVKKLETSVNKKVAGLLYEGTNINNQDLSVKVWKAQDFNFTIKNNVIEYRVPLKIWSRFAWTVEKFGISMGDHYEANGSIALNFKTTINIDKDWKLVAKTVPAGYSWIETPKLNVVGINVPVTPIANIALEKSQKMITDQIDLSLQQMVELKKYMQMAWTEMQKPMQANEANNLWLRITPKDVFVSPFSTVGQKLNIGMSLSAQIESFMGVQPQANKPVPLPAFKNVARINKDFNVNVAADVTFEKISEMAKSQLINKTFSEGNKSITITDLSIFGSEGKAVFVADVKGSVKGRIYFTGNLVYNAEKMAVEIQNPEFDVKSKNALLKSASWLLHGLILNKLTPYLTYPVKSDIDDMKKQANDMLKNYKVYDGIFLNGTINNMTVTGLNLVPGAVRITANAGGNVMLKVDELNF